MPPPAPLDAARVHGAFERMTAEERELAEQLRNSDEFHDHCETQGIGQTWGALCAFALWHGRGRIWSFGDTATEQAARRQAYEAIEARDPWLRLKTIVERAMTAADELDEAARLARMATGTATRKHVPPENLAAAATQFQRDNPQATYSEVVQAVMDQTGAARDAVRLAMRDRPERRSRGRRRK
jgi:hypothetical protein